MRARRAHGGAGRARRVPRTSSRDALPAPLLAVFQPSEEAYPSGAQQLARGSARERSRRRRSSPRTCTPSCAWGAVALDPGTVNASCDAFEITVEGEPSHGAYPHRGRDPILAIAQVVVALHAQLGRRIDPLRPGVADGRRARGGQRRERDPRSARTRAGRCAPTGRRTGSRCAQLVEEVAQRRRGGARLPRERRAPARRAGARERRARSSAARASCSQRAGFATAAPSGARAAPTTSPSSARSRRWRWRSSGSTAPRASPRARCTTRSCCRPTPPSAPSRGCRPSCMSPPRRHRRRSWADDRRDRRRLTTGRASSDPHRPTAPPIGLIGARPPVLH